MMLASKSSGAMCNRMGAMLNAEDGVRPLTALVEVVVPQAECVLTSMLSTWYLVKDRHSKAV